MIAIEKPNEHKGELVMVRPSKFTVQNSKHIKSFRQFDAIMTENPKFNKDKLVWEAEFWTPPSRSQAYTNLSKIARQLEYKTKK